jgi:hypothetical protein
MKVLLILLILCVVSVHIPHNNKKYNFSWHFRFLTTITLIYFIIKTKEDGIGYIPENCNCE